MNERRHAKLAVDVWTMICALGDPEVGTSMVLRRDEDFHSAAINLIEMACDSAAEIMRFELLGPSGD